MRVVGFPDVDRCRPRPVPSHVQRGRPAGEHPDEVLFHPVLGALRPSRRIHAGRGCCHYYRPRRPWSHERHAISSFRSSALAGSHVSRSGGESTSPAPGDPPVTAGIGRLAARGGIAPGDPLKPLPQSRFARSTMGSRHSPARRPQPGLIGAHGRLTGESRVDTVAAGRTAGGRAAAGGRCADGLCPKWGVKATRGPDAAWNGNNPAIRFDTGPGSARSRMQGRLPAGAGRDARAPAHAARRGGRDRPARRRTGCRQGSGRRGPPRCGPHRATAGSFAVPQQRVPWPA